MLDKKDKILILGSCFATNIGQRLSAEGFDVCINPFGTLFNPVSIHNSLKRLESGEPFTERECIQMGAGSDLWCSFSHYTKFARSSKEEFLENANNTLHAASEFYRQCNKIIITFGTAYCFRHIQQNCIVSNCLKRNAKEFERFMLGVEDIVQLYVNMDKDCIFTVSPIRHLADGAHGNQLSKSTLLLAIEAIIKEDPIHRSYFPSYEIMLDDLRDYSWYAEDKVHPSEDAVKFICDRFLSADNLR